MWYVAVRSAAPAQGWRDGRARCFTIETHRRFIGGCEDGSKQCAPKDEAIVGGACSGRMEPLGRAARFGGNARSDRLCAVGACVLGAPRRECELLRGRA